MSAQTDTVNQHEFDENDVFNRLFSSKKSTHRHKPVDSLRRIFADVETPPTTIRVEDFLPSYED